MTERIDKIEHLLGGVIEELNRLSTASSATYLVNRSILSSLISALKVADVDLDILSRAFETDVQDRAQAMPIEKRHIFLAEARQWMDFLAE